MKYASIDGARSEPFPKTHGICPHCRGIVIAKCGKLRVWHWAHKSKRHCDRWWEPETEWHRLWKNRFPVEWQEQGRRDENGELHIADVLTPHGLVVEFQHSAIEREEVEIRTNFHKSICWIVNGSRLESSLAQFEEALEWCRPVGSRGSTVYEFQLSHSRLLRKWADLEAPVVIDFGLETVWVIGRNLGSSALVYPLKKDLLVEQLKRGNRPPPVQIERAIRTRVGLSLPRRGIGRRL